MEEPEKSVKFAVAQLIAVLARHEFRLAVGWPELIAFLQTGLSSQGRHFPPFPMTLTLSVSGESFVANPHAETRGRLTD